VKETSFKSEQKTNGLIEGDSDDEDCERATF